MCLSVGMLLKSSLAYSTICVGLHNSGDCSFSFDHVMTWDYMPGIKMYSTNGYWGNTVLALHRHDK